MPSSASISKVVLLTCAVGEGRPGRVCGEHIGVSSTVVTTCTSAMTALDACLPVVILASNNCSRADAPRSAVHVREKLQDNTCLSRVRCRFAGLHRLQLDARQRRHIADLQAVGCTSGEHQRLARRAPSKDETLCSHCKSLQNAAEQPYVCDPNLDGMATSLHAAPTTCVCFGG